MRNRPGQQEGFTLIELAVVLTLASSFIVFIMQLAQMKMQQNKVEMTRQRMEYVVKTLENYVRRNGRLPCPADPTLAFTAAAFGREKTGASDCSTVAGDHLERTTAATPNAYAGIVPVYTLGLPASYALDAWNNRFTYAVDGDLTTTTKFGSNPATGTYNGTPASGDIKVRNWTVDDINNLCGEPLSDGATPAKPTCGAASIADGSQAAIVLVSHGANGYGAWGAYGGSARMSNSGTTGAETKREYANSNRATTGPAVTAAVNIGIYYQSPIAGVYDDIVVYRRKWHFPTPCTTSCP